MAAITPVAYTPPFTTFRTAAAQATTGQTDWIAIPPNVQLATVFFNLTANAGTTPISTVSFLANNPGNLLDDTDTMTLFAGAAITAASQHRYMFAPGISGIADGTDSAAADASVAINCILPVMFGVKVLNDRTTGDETYTYSLSIRCEFP